MEKGKIIELKKAQEAKIENIAVGKFMNFSRAVSDYTISKIYIIITGAEYSETGNNINTIDDIIVRKLAVYCINKMLENTELFTGDIPLAEFMSKVDAYLNEIIFDKIEHIADFIIENPE